MFLVLFCNFREIFCGFHMSTDFLFSLKLHQSMAKAAARRWAELTCCGMLPVPATGSPCERWSTLFTPRYLSLVGEQ